MLRRDDEYEWYQHQGVRKRREPRRRGRDPLRMVAIFLLILFIAYVLSHKHR